MGPAGRRAASAGAAVAATSLLAAGAAQLLQRTQAGCDDACTVVTTHRGTLLFLAGLFLASVAALAWPRDAAARPPAPP